LLQWAATAGFRPGMVASANATATPVQRVAIPNNGNIHTEEQVTYIQIGCIHRCQPSSENKEGQSARKSGTSPGSKHDGKEGLSSQKRAG